MKQGRVVLADSHQNMMEGIRGLLETVFEVVVMVADETSLLDTVDTVNPDLVVVDLSLPVSEEMNVARSFSRAKPGMKFLILSVHDDRTAVDECMASGACGFVLKRTAADDLLPAVEEVLRGGRYVSASVRT
ncbi:MAG TPA: hypothetical protein DCO77_01975 [Nitrospiraceae bacterium]|nr:hypothetical protein [Nitrospiraceae bacterium]